MKKTFVTSIIALLILLTTPTWAATSDQMDPSMPGMSMDQSNTKDNASAANNKKSRSTSQQGATSTDTTSNDKNKN